MKPIFVATATLVTACLASPAIAENLNHTSQLLSTRRCPFCDLSNAGLVRANLAGAQLQGADLRNANLSRADLTGVDLTGADLSGASLYGANLQGAILRGANLNGTDLRGAYLIDADFSNTSLDNAYIESAIGIPNEAATPERFYRLGVAETERGNYQAAIVYYDQALSLDPTFAPALLARGISLYHLGDDPGAAENTVAAYELFVEQENTAGVQTAQNFLLYMELARQPTPVDTGNPNFGQAVGGVASLLLQLLF